MYIFLILFFYLLIIKNYQKIFLNKLSYMNESSLNNEKYNDSQIIYCNLLFYNLK